MAPDGDALDVLVCVSEPTFPRCYVLAKAIGLFRMADEKGPDDHAGEALPWRACPTCVTRHG